jgi:hypothetical protein
MLMPMQIITKYSPLEIMDILRVNVESDHWFWWQNRKSGPSQPICGKVGLSDFVLKRKKMYPSFFTALLKGDAIEEENGTRITISTSLNLLPKLLAGFFAVMFILLLIGNIPLPTQVNKTHFIVFSAIGVILFFVGKLSIKPEERYLYRFLEELFEGSHVIYT